MNAIAELVRLPQTLSERKSFVEACVNEVISGNRNPIEFELLLKGLEDTVKEIRKNSDVKDYVMQEAKKYPDKSFSYGNATITKSSRATPDFTEDEEYVRLNKALKERAELLKGLKKPMADSETGEMIYPPVYKYSEFLTIKFDK